MEYHQIRYHDEVDINQLPALSQIFLKKEGEKEPPAIF